MNKNIFYTLFSIAMLAALAACSVIPVTGGSDPLTASGTIEANSVNLSAETGGKIAAVNVALGDSVKAGQVVFSLDDASLQAQRGQAAANLKSAQAGLAAAQANLNLLQAGPTAGQVQAAQAQVDQAAASRQALQAQVDNLSTGRPEDISAAQAKLAMARQSYYNLAAPLSAQQLSRVFQSLTQSQSGLSLAKFRQDQEQAGTQMPSSALDAAAKTVVDAQAVQDSAGQAYQVGKDPTQPTYLQVAAVQKTLQIAQVNLNQAQARQNALRADSDMPKQALDDAQSAVDDAQAMVDKAKAASDALNSGDAASRLNAAWSQMQSAQNDLNALGKAGGASNLAAMLSQMDAASAQQDAASANLASLKSGARPEQVAAAQAQVDAAQAQVDAAQAALGQVDVLIAQRSVSAPVSGVVLDRALNPGEMASPGQAVVQIGDLDTVTLRVYLPEDQYGKIELGESVSVKVDSLPNRTFTGAVSYISSQAEFTPRNVQTKDTRSTTVYAVEIRLPNPDHALRPGMPADATF